MLVERVHSGSMDKPFILFCLVGLLMSCTAQTQEVIPTSDLTPEETFEAFLLEQNAQFRDSEQSPLLEKDRKRFVSLNYFPYDDSYRVQASWTPTPDEKPFLMPTSTERTPRYVKAGYFTFEWEDRVVNLSAYKNLELPKGHPYREMLFIPFNDLTNGEESYGGGRYMDVTEPVGSGRIDLDLNLTYHPYCAYNYKYSCPIPPDENMLDIAVRAGVKSGINGEHSDH